MSATSATSSTPTPGGTPFNASAACPAYEVPEAITSALAAKQIADDQKIAAASAEINADASRMAAQKQKVADQLAAEQAAATEEASRKPLLGRVFERQEGRSRAGAGHRDRDGDGRARAAATAAVERRPHAAAAGTRPPSPPPAAAAPRRPRSTRPRRRPLPHRSRRRKLSQRLRLAGGGRGRRGRHQVPAVRARRPAAHGELTKQASRSRVCERADRAPAELPRWRVDLPFRQAVGEGGQRHALLVDAGERGEGLHVRRRRTPRRSAAETPRSRRGSARRRCRTSRHALRPAGRVREAWPRDAPW